MRRDLWEADRISLNRPVDVPAAVCLTKIDRLADFHASSAEAIDDYLNGLCGSNNLAGPAGRLPA